MESGWGEEMGFLCCYSLLPARARPGGIQEPRASSWPPLCVAVIQTLGLPSATAQMCLNRDLGSGMESPGMPSTAAPWHLPLPLTWCGL